MNLKERDAYYRVHRIVRRLEHTPLVDDRLQQRLYRVPFQPCGYIAKNGGSTIPALSGSTLGSGTVTRYDLAPGGGITSAETLTAYNMSGVAIGANHFLVIMWVQGQWVIVAEAC